jgi:hypothetical protein
MKVKHKSVGNENACTILITKWAAQWGDSRSWTLDKNEN